VKVRVARTEDGRYHISAVRSDGVTVSMAGHGFAHRLPRDLAHFAVEDALELRHGFWGSVAAGALLPGVTIAEGQPPSSEGATKGAAIVVATAQSVADSRGLVATFDEIIDRKLDGHWPQVDPALQTLTIRRGARLVSLTKTDVARVATVWRALQARWDDVPVGGALELEWKAPLMSGSWPALR
jgi:hypothetical protein